MLELYKEYLEKKTDIIWNVVNASIFDASENVIIAGNIEVGSDLKFAVGKFTKIRGDYDTDFGGGDGYEVIDAAGAGGNQDCQEIVKDDSENLYLVGYTDASDAQNKFYVVKLDSSSNTVNWDGTDTYKIYDISSNSGNSEAYSAVYDGSSHIYIAGDTFIDPSYNIAVIKISTSDGSLDTNFGNNGIKIISDVSNNNLYARSIILVNDNLYIGGSVSSGIADIEGDNFVVCIDSSGDLVNTLGTYGILTYDISNDSNLSTNLLYSTTTNKIIATGYSNNSLSIATFDVSGGNLSTDIVEDPENTSKSWYSTFLDNNEEIVVLAGES